MLLLLCVLGCWGVAIDRSTAGVVAHALLRSLLFFTLINATRIIAYMSSRLDRLFIMPLETDKPSLQRVACEGPRP